jgi:CDP-diacylglycerol--inositol 3-phosphatidyltransferase
MDTPPSDHFVSHHNSENIFLFVPNLIGYARIVLALLSFWYMSTNYVLTTIFYLLSGLLDAFDGHAARYLNQGTKFGAMLDMLTDRCATLCLLMALCHFYPQWMFLFQLSAAIDVASHWLHLHSSIMRGADSHKSIDLSGNTVLRVYYTNRIVLFCMCAGNELFYAMLYLSYFTHGPKVASIGLWPAMAVAFFPVAFVKSLISLIHLYAASINMGAIDTAERDEKRRPEKAKNN